MNRLYYYNDPIILNINWLIDEIRYIRRDLFFNRSSMIDIERDKLIYRLEVCEYELNKLKDKVL